MANTGQLHVVRASLAVRTSLCTKVCSIGGEVDWVSAAQMSIESRETP